MPGMTPQTFRDILESFLSGLEVLEVEKANAEDDAPTDNEKAAIDRIQYVLRTAVNAIRAELPKAN